MSSFKTAFAEDIFHNKYAHKVGERKETWSEMALRVVTSVMGAYMPRLVAPVIRLVEEKKFIPGGRYLYAAGRPYPQVNNCFLFSVPDSREGWGDLSYNCINALMTGGGVGVVYSALRGEGTLVRGMGGTSTGPCSLMQMINEDGRHIMQGGSRRAAIWAGLIWDHPDIFKFITLKNYSPLQRKCKEEDFNFALPMDMTNMSVILDSRFFTAFYNPTDPKHKLAQDVFWTTVRQMVKTGEPAFSVDTGVNEGENLRNAPVHGDTLVLTGEGYQRVADIVGTPTHVWTGKQWAPDVVFSKTGEMVPTLKVTMTGGREIICDPSHPFLVEHYEGKGSRRKMTGVERVPAQALEEGDVISVSLPTPEMDAAEDCVGPAYVLGFVYGDGSFVSKRCAELTLCTPQKERCAEKFTGVSFTHKRDSRGYAHYYFNSNPLFEGLTKDRAPHNVSPVWIASFLAGVFDADGHCDPALHRISVSSVKLSFIKDLQRMLESVGILANISSGGGGGKGSFSHSPTHQLVVAADYVKRFMEVIPTSRVRFDVTDYKPYRKSVVKVVSVEPCGKADVYCADVKVEEHSFQAEGVLISNCTEVTSRDNGDCCNIGSLNMAAFTDHQEFQDALPLSVAFLLCGTLYSKLPVELMHKVREKNRRLGLGLMGVHAWLVKRGYPYGMCGELAQWMRSYAQAGQMAQDICEHELEISSSVGTRSIAPTGTISIVAETTSGIEPVFAAGYKRRFLRGTEWKYQYVVDSIVHDLVQGGADPALIEDAYTLAEDVDRRIKFQCDMQKYVDHGISSTINLPQWGSSVNNENTVRAFGDTLLKYLPELRGITAYPDGARGGQPLNRVSYFQALSNLGKEFQEGGLGRGEAELQNESCKVGGFCNS